MSKPFNLEAAIAGEPVETRAGNKVTEFHYFATDKGNYPITAVISGYREIYTKRGNFLADDVCDMRDLVMSSKKRKAWHCVCMYKGELIVPILWGETEEELRKRVADSSVSSVDAVILGTYCTEWEE